MISGIVTLSPIGKWTITTKHVCPVKAEVQMEIRKGKINGLYIQLYGRDQKWQNYFLTVIDWNNIFHLMVFEND